ncbi:MAG: cyclopropane fatty acyl phospholipid synthase [Desulfomonilia bacterium]|nr:cyclopropane fatty acyl phospholipid synthase [Desulfomonilia bacterium]
MTSYQAREIVQQLCTQAGITLNGSGPADIRVHNENLYERILKGGSLALGESYMDGWWECEALDQFFDTLLRARMLQKLKGNWNLLWPILRARVFNLQSRSRSFQVGVKHYDIGNDLYKAMLDSNMLYTCGYWKDARTLDEAQVAKMDLVCRKIELEPGMTVLELGCGWGTFARYAAQQYGAHVTAVTVSREQVSLGRDLCRGLPVEITLDDYRNVRGTYDRVVSIGVMEHVGSRNYRTYMKTVDRTLKDDGIAFFHTIGGNTSRFNGDPWLHKYIFPNGMIPSIAQLARAMEGLFIMEDWHNFGPDYDATLMSWHERFERAWPELRDTYGERFHRMWRYYLLSCAGAFRSRYCQVWQVVMTRPSRKQPRCRIC